METLNDLADPRRDEAFRFAEANGNAFLAQAAKRLRKKLNETPPADPPVVLKKTRQRAHRTIEAMLGRGMAFFLPAVLLVGASIVMFFFLREKPPEQSVEQADETAVAPARNTIWQNIRLTLTTPALWFLAVALGLLNACRYGFLDWGLTHLLEETDTTLGKAGLKYAVLPLGGIAGAYWSGWVTDRWFGGRRMPVICLLLILLGVLTLLYNFAIQAGLELSIALLFIIGFSIYGPQVLLVGTAPIDMARKGAAAAAVGFVNFMGYLGAFAGDQVTGWLKDRHEWHVPLMFWAGCAFAAAAAAACQWNTRPGDATGERPT
jgi:sugar phosphate permease